MVIRKKSLFVTTSVIAASTVVGLMIGNASRPARADVEGVAQAQLFPSWTRVSAKCTGKGKKIKCRIKGKISIVNDGGAQSAATTVDIWVSQDDVLDPKADKKVQTIDVPAINAEDEVELNFNFSAPKGTKVLKRQLIAVVDPNNQVAESDEDDNEEAIGPLR